MSRPTLTARERHAVEAVAAGRVYPTIVRERGGWFARWRDLDGEGDELIDTFVRMSSPSSRRAERGETFPTVHDAWLAALESATGRVLASDEECAALSRTLESWHGDPKAEAAARSAIAFTLDCRGSDDEPRFSLSTPPPRGRESYRQLGRAAEVFGPLRSLSAKVARRGERKLVAELTREEAERFLRTGARSLEAAGYRVRCDSCSAAVDAIVELVESPSMQGSAPERPPVSEHIVIRVAGEPVTAEEIRFLLDQNSPLVFFRNRWIEVDRAILRNALKVLEKLSGRRLGESAALAFACGLGSLGGVEIAEIRAHGWLRGLLNELRGDERFKPKANPERLAVRLRPYQLRGYSWLSFLTAHGFGALLADDMGLGKTAQTIAWMCDVAAAGVKEPFLVVAPLTLLANWRREIAKFAPSLSVYVHQGDMRRAASGFAAAARASAVVITSYALFVREYPLFRDVAWAGAVLDEAQAVKNPDTRVARAACALSAPRRVALTGTPVENSPADVWSIEEFLNPGFLGTRAEFAERFAKPILAGGLADSAAAKKLRRALEPFILRRLKTDPEIAGELGPKREIREYCSLSARQRADYEAALADWRAGERRQGDVFALLTRLKLVCDGYESGDGESGKQMRLVELLESIFAAGESALVFTQYAKVGAALKAMLERRFDTRFAFLHGSLSAAEREREIAEFESGGAKAFILSLKAGGYGLNLVKATHVIHFDRWWNPAVEAQATDRAHRIGQSSTVFVHALVTAGTLEERIDEILESKRSLAGSLVVGGERFLASMSREEFERTVSLDGD